MNLLIKIHQINEIQYYIQMNQEMEEMNEEMEIVKVEEENNKSIL